MFYSKIYFRASKSTFWKIRKKFGLNIFTFTKTSLWKSISFLPKKWIKCTIVKLIAILKGCYGNCISHSNGNPRAFMQKVSLGTLLFLYLSVGGDKYGISIILGSDMYGARSYKINISVLPLNSFIATLILLRFSGMNQIEHSETGFG